MEQTKNYPIEVILTGEFTSVDLRLENNEIALVEVEDNVYRKKFKNFAVNGLLNLNVILKTWLGLDWKLTIKISLPENRTNTYVFKGTAVTKRFISFARAFDPEKPQEGEEEIIEIL